MDQLPLFNTEELTQRIAEALYEFSNGSFHTKDHPFATSNPNPPSMNINKQSGLLQSQWEVTQIADVLTIRNSTPYTEYLINGTEKMIARPIEELVNNTIEEYFRRN